MPSPAHDDPFAPLVKQLQKWLTPPSDASPGEQLTAQREATWLAEEWPHLQAQLTSLSEQPEAIQQQAIELLAEFFRDQPNLSIQAAPSATAPPATAPPATAPPATAPPTEASTPQLMWPGKDAHHPGQVPPLPRQVLSLPQSANSQQAIHLVVRPGSRAPGARQVMRWPVWDPSHKKLNNNTLAIFFEELPTEGRAQQQAALDAATTHLRDNLAAHPSFGDGLKALFDKPKHQRLRRELKAFIRPQPRTIDVPIAPRQQWEARLQAFLSNWQFAHASETPLRAGQSASLAWWFGQPLMRIPAAVDECRRQLWLKAPFVRRRDHCLQLDGLPNAFRKEALSNPAQRAEWAETDPAAASQLPPANARTEALTEAAGRLVLDTRHFGSGFGRRLEAALRAQDTEHETRTTNEAIHGDNAQALRLLAAGEQERTSLVYIDPPFNLDTQPDFHYRVRFRPAEWLRLLRERLQAALPHLREDAVFFIRCDYHGAHLLRQLAEEQGLHFRAEILIDRSRNRAGSANKMEVTYDHLFLFTREEVPLKKFTLPRSVANLKWTGFLMPGERRPRERRFLGKILHPPDGQHWALTQEKVERVQAEFNLRLRCRDCGAHLYAAEDTPSLSRQMKAKAHRHKFYDLRPQTPFFGTRALTACPGCGGENFRVQYLGADEAFVNDRWLDLPSYARTWSFPTENAEVLLGRVLRFQEDGRVLDFFAGSGTTAAVAHKLGRPWRIVEAGPHFDSVLRPRLKRVLAGEQSGLSAEVGWQGGGSFACLRLESFDEARQALRDKPPADPCCLAYHLDEQGRLRLDERLFARPFEAYSELANGETLPLDLPATLEKLLGLEVMWQRWETADAEGRSAPLLGQIARQSAGTLIGILWRNAAGAGQRSDAELAGWIRHLRPPAGATPASWLVNGAFGAELSKLGAEPLEAAFANQMMARAIRP